MNGQLQPLNVLYIDYVNLLLSTSKGNCCVKKVQTQKRKKVIVMWKGTKETRSIIETLSLKGVCLWEETYKTKFIYKTKKNVSLITTTLQLTPFQNQVWKPEILNVGSPPSMNRITDYKKIIAFFVLHKLFFKKMEPG